MAHTIFGDRVTFYNIAHRGYSSVAPENTIAAFEKAIGAGANMLELDVMLTGDGQLIVFHDYRLGRTTNGTGVVSKLTSDHIRSLDAGSWFAQEFRSEHVPSLDDVLELAKGKVKLDIELKQRRHDATSILVGKSIKAVERHRMSDEVVFSSFNLEALRILHHVSPGLRLAPLYRHNIKPTRRSFALRYGAQAVVLNHLLLNRITVKKFHDSGIAVLVYTVNAPWRMEKLIQMKVDGIISDDPAALDAVRGEIPG